MGRLPARQDGPGPADGGPVAGFEALARRERPALVRSCTRLVGPDRAQDAAQAALLAAWRAMGSGAEIRDPVAWLHRVARNAALRALAAERGAPTGWAERPEAAPSAEAQLERVLLLRDVVKAVWALPEAQREALLLTAVEDRAGGDVAGRLGISEPALRQLVRRARLAVGASLR